MDNTSDAISRIKGWSEIDKDRLESIEDSRDIDDTSMDANLTQTLNTTDLENVIFEVNNLKVTDKVGINSAILGSWYTTPRRQQLSVLLTMYGHGGWDQDNNDSLNQFLKMMQTDGQYTAQN